MFQQNNSDLIIEDISSHLKVLPFQIRMPIAMIEGPDYLRLTDLSLNLVISSGIQVQGDPGHFVYDKFEQLPVATYYWFLGKQFRGDMVSFSTNH